MAGYMLELLHDLANDKLDIDTKCDIIVATKELLVAGVIQQSDIKELCAYLRGIKLSNYDNVVFLIARLEEKTQYTDAKFVDKWLSNNPQYVIVRHVLLKKLKERGRTLCLNRRRGTTL